MFDYKMLFALGIFLCYLETIASTEDVCVKKGPCSCEFSNGTGIDLSPTANGFAMTQTYELKNEGSQYSLSTYYYHPCYDIQLKINTTKVIGTCGNPLSVSTCLLRDFTVFKLVYIHLIITGLYIVLPATIFRFCS